MQERDPARQPEGSQPEWRVRLPLMPPRRVGSEGRTLVWLLVNNSTYTFSLFMACVAFVGASCVQSSHAPTPQVIAPSAAPAALLKALRERLDDVRSRAPVTDSYENWGSEDVRPLIGLSKSDLEQALGPHEGCRMEGARRNCRDDRTWLYSFYDLPPGSLGGGPELALEFDARGVVTTVEWYHSK